MIILTTFPFYRTRWGKLLDAKEERDTFLRDALIVEVIPTTAFGLAEKHAMSPWHLVLNLRDHCKVVLMLLSRSKF